MDHRKTIEQVLGKHNKIDSVYWVGCGGSLIDLYPAHCLINAESGLLSSNWQTSHEFLLAPPKRLGENSLAIVCSHSGNTSETVEAARLAFERGAAVVALTDTPASKIDNPDYHVQVYPWYVGVPTAQVPLGICLTLAAELIRQQEGDFPNDIPLRQGIQAIDRVIQGAIETVGKGMTDEFARLCQEHPFFYILGSGASFSQTYGFAICSLMEMQRQHCSYIHSAEYFHGPFETTENGVFYFLQMGSGLCRGMDERALRFLKTHTDRLMVLDTLALGMDQIDFSVRDYLDPVLLYAMNVEFRAARGRLFNHPVETRRYMQHEDY
jgi:fructoselysine 6-phosphate deglycase